MTFNAFRDIPISATSTMHRNEPNEQQQAINETKPNMTPSRKAALITTALAIALLALTFSLLPGQSHAAGIGGGEQYKVIEADSGKPGAAAAIEQHLNALATEGWKVRAATAQGFIILAK